LFDRLAGRDEIEDAATEFGIERLRQLVQPGAGEQALRFRPAQLTGQRHWRKASTRQAVKRRAMMAAPAGPANPFRLYLIH
jgi:hypothetical protein